MRKAYITTLYDETGTSLDFSKCSLRYEIKWNEEVIASGPAMYSGKGEVMAVFNSYSIKNSGLHAIAFIATCSGTETIYSNQVHI